MVFKTLLLFSLLPIVVVAQQHAQENRVQQSAGGQTTFFQQQQHQQYPSNSQTTNSCCQPMQPQQLPAPVQTRTQTTKTWQISGYSARQQSPQSPHSQPQINNHNVEYRNVEGQSGGESLRIDYNSGRCVVTLDTITENGVPRGLDAHSKAKFRSYADQLNSWQHQLRGKLSRDGDGQQGTHWNNEPRVPDCPCAAQFCGQANTQNSPQNQQSNWPQPASLNSQSQQQQTHTTHSYEFQFNNGRCVLKDGQVTEDGRPRGLNANERAKLDEFKRQFDQYSQRLHNEMKQKFNSYLTRDSNQHQQQGSGSLVIREFTPSSPPEPPCLCSEVACGKQ
ncbi:unnamed protein product, partial [Mesorhabditis belari]|uniref:Uncharacterized protein n=1 Tax=Mesorhabditis belari TaxID=2138241 RepID=A0AAF3J9I3_9BILA